MPGAQAYLEGVQRLLQEMGVGSINLDISEDDTAGRLTASVRLRGRCRLEVDARLTFFRAPLLHKYSFQLLSNDDDQLLRYDNVPHHPNLAGFPHHQHRLGSDAEPVTPAPSIRTILGAIEDELESRAR